jgi:hypothetical protein
LRRPCFGELIQIDGSDHRWFEDRATPCVLLVFIDDATGQLVGMHFCHAESTFEYMNVTKRYLLEYGKPVAFYSDKHAVFRVNKAGGTRGEGITQFGRALHDLNIESICANSPAAGPENDKIAGQHVTGAAPVRWTVSRLRFLISSPSILHPKRGLPPAGGRSSERVFSSVRQKSNAYKAPRAEISIDPWHWDPRKSHAATVWHS